MKDLEKWVVDPSAPFLWPSICPLVSLVVRVILSHDLLPQSPGNRTEGEGLETEVMASLQSPCNSRKDFAVFGKSFSFLFHFFTPLYVFNENNEIQIPTSFFHCRSLFVFQRMYILWKSCKTQNSGLRSKEEKPRDPIDQPSRCNTQEGLLSVVQTG